MKIPKIVTAIAGAALAVSLAACGQGGGSGAGGNGPLIAIVSKGFQHQFWQAVKKGAEDEASAKGARITFVGPATEQDVEQQVNMLTNELAKSPQALGFAALDSRAAAPLLQQAKSQKIPVIAFDSGVDSDIPATTVATDNKAAAAEAAKHLAEQIGGQGKVAMVVHDQTSLSGKDRRDGFLDWMRQNAPGITVLPPQYGGGDQLQSANITKSILQANPDLKGIYGSNEGSAIGVIKGVQESGKTGITIAGFDSGKAQIDAINSGAEAGAITQDPVDIGRQLVDAALKAINGQQLPKRIDTAYYWYDKTNIGDPKIQAALYQ
ncbi:ABC transporter substrate-binding protein [Amycolatopsis acidiphila]|uniref:Substrate-binding domain-containing protein n=1 Tax=Amycolatopsis acidiphila TaxID=715473 RepID=A0A558A459_9PSEU|nr:ABC transporter substrate-binding protein [Amycolatopsis acidiphila]TVT19049.1 substrate-binding domain-containing protein [Amycolatopsis acidiphila]UIJ63710.1 ABC transporter substrate-binding protein [Amycolatopsis acidiphila]GHG67303.1 LacI family transcriptional regulator [Amycolatopsis acidiphila]